MNPIDRIKAKIIEVTPGGKIILEANYYNWPLLEKRGYKEAHVEFIDSRPLSDKQRKMCWAMVGEIADWMGQSRSATTCDLVNEGRKIDFLVNEIGENADRLFSLSNAPMSLVAAYQKYLVHFIIENDVPTKKPLLEYADDIGDYVYYCMIHKKCVICGQHCDLHHIDRVGMGGHRDDMIHEGMEAITLRRDYHTEIHTIGDTAFFEKYHLDGGIVMDKTLCKIYKLKARKEI